MTKLSCEYRWLDSRTQDLQTCHEAWSYEDGGHGENKASNQRRRNATLVSSYLQGVASHLLIPASFVHVVLLFPTASLMIHRACSEKGCRDRRRFRPGAVVVTIVYSVCCSSASARRAVGRYCLFRRMSGSVIPVTTDSMTVGFDRLHPDTRRRLLFSAASSRCVWALRHHTGEQHSAGAKASAIVFFEER